MGDGGCELVARWRHARTVDRTEEDSGARKEDADRGQMQDKERRGRGHGSERMSNRSEEAEKRSGRTDGRAAADGGSFVILHA